MAIYRLEDGCVLVSEHGDYLCCPTEHDFSERRQQHLECGETSYNGISCSTKSRVEPISQYLYDLCSKCGARLYPPGAFKEEARELPNCPTCGQNKGVCFLGSCEQCGMLTTGYTDPDEAMKAFAKLKPFPEGETADD